MTDIQQARDVLATWRAGATTLPWSKSEAFNAIVSGAGYVVSRHSDPTDTRLIVGTAGNPALLDAIDGMLRLAHEWKHGAPGKNIQLVRQGERIAAAIITADEQMNGAGQ